MSSYTDTTIIECNNQASSEVLGGNNTSPASFTNKLDNVLQLKRGDKVSVDYCFVNERGCGTPNAVEIKGVSLNKNKTWNIIKRTSKGEEPIQSRTRMETALYQSLKPEPITKKLTDDKAYVETNYYKSTNCEGYYFLPRRFAFARPTTTEPNKVALRGDGTHPDIKDIYYGLSHDGKDALSTTEPRYFEWWDTEDSYALGRCKNETGRSETSADDADIYSICMSDYQEYFTSGGFGYYRPKNDGTRYTIICREEMIQDSSYNSDASTYWTTDDAVNYVDPALGKYNIYNELIELSLPIGFNSPENIAARLTQQLQETQEEELYTLLDNGLPQTERIWTSTISTNTFKPFNCGWFGGNAETNYNAYSSEEDKKLSWDYDCSYQYLGVKRPDLFMAGRKVMNYDGTTQYFIKNDILGSAVGPPANVNSEIVTGIEFTKNNLENLSELFKIQSRYPELWKGNEILTGTDYTIDNTRFLHINRYDNTTGAIENILGYDNYEAKGDGKNRASMPLFFYYDKDNEGIMTSGTETSNLSYGFATKKTHDNGDGTFTDFIVLHPELAGGIRPYVFKFNADIDKETRLIGWDFHFNSYGNNVIQLYSGYQSYTYDALYNYGLASRTFNDKPYATGPDEGSINEHRYLPPNWTGALISRIYLGANNPSVVYDQTSHFGFKDLHTPENVGQGYDAGSNADTNPKDNATASTICYKMNKRLQLWNFTPEMKPYKVGDSKAYGILTGKLKGPDVEYENDASTYAEASLHEDYAHGSHAILWGEENYSALNQAITPYTIMDAHGGISLNIGGSYDEDTFNDGLFGLLGFTYSQTAPTNINDVNNRTARITNTNMYQLEWITTNAQIVETQIQNFVVNRYGAIQFSGQIPTPLMLEGWVNQDPGKDGATNTYPARLSAYTIYPPIVETTSSIVVTGELLPRRMVRPYYCIRSDLVLHEKQKYVGGRDSGDKLPIIAVVNKENGDGDYFFSVDSPIQFTITNDINISSIKTSIHDPDQSLSSVGDGCCVVYRIERNKVLDNTIIQEILQNQQKK